MKVLFIGGTGNISTAVSRLCVERGIDLYLLNRGTSKVKIDGANTIVGDIHQPQKLSGILQNQKWDVVVNWIAFNAGDIERDINLFREKTKQYVFISSASVYQKPVQFPYITESTPLINPFWDYSRNKIACEEKLNTAYREEGFPITIVRPSLTYDTVIPVVIGGWKEYTIIDRIKKGKKIIVHGDGASLWTITHARDFAKGFVGLLGHQQAIGHAFHITSDEILTWNQIYQAIAEAAGAEANLVHIASDFICQIENSLIGSLLGDKAHSVIFDNSKIKKFVPDFVATIPFKTGIKQTVSWFEADASRMVINAETNIMMDKIIQTYERLLP
ncbi:NAD-dependent epimerase/dehydratase family protein [candidate division KSB1 bacterium]|nr:NAD-dependent epimerase/dehydratase family protein [candidate division KSB1 bacterium]